jgi:hypothetical protein
MVPNKPNIISIEIWAWLQANKQKVLFGPADAARPTKQQANFGPWLVLNAQVYLHGCASESASGYQTRPTLPAVANLLHVHLVLTLQLKVWCLGDGLGTGGSGVCYCYKSIRFVSIFSFFLK